ncbi:MAG TPA: indole-3-glycerol phosphate synthase TrpC [Pyrinomonadaceae bacterium]|jgi:indole-3-glycerol phosphate synthase
MSRLAEIIEKKRERLAISKTQAHLEKIQSLASDARQSAPRHALHDALIRDDRINIIAEFKRRSPSKGTINGDADPAAVARVYERGGAAAISVLTEEDFFSGSLDDLRAVRRQTPHPILRKDFILDDYQVYESAAAGADALLLIVAALDDDSLRSLRELTEDGLAMDALVEVHTRDEMRRAIYCGANIIGVNNRNLATFEVSLSTSIELAAVASPATRLISESGIESSEDIDRLRDAGYHGFLIGETLMRAADPETLLKEFTQIRAGTRTSA